LAERLANKHKINYVDGDEALLDQIKPLWEALNRYHLGLSENFKQYYLDMTFQKRKADLLKKVGLGEMHVDIAVSKASGQNVGYCVSTVTLEKMGEIKSIFVDEAFRGMGIGNALMQKALIWIEQNGAVEKIVEVAAGNERAWSFYARYGFLPRKTMLKQIKKPKSPNLP
jgi:ribosomal protein S18 acetylase RimI-like enzyme